jgi:hypothetical protein
MDGQTDGQMDRYMDGQMDGQTDEQTDGQIPIYPHHWVLYLKTLRVGKMMNLFSSRFCFLLF